MPNRPVKSQPPVPEASPGITKPTDAFAALRSSPKPDPVVQAAADAYSEAASALPGHEQTDAPGLAAIANAEPALSAEEIEAQKFDDQYKAAANKSMGYLVRRRVEGNRNALVPPACEIHPKLGAWGLNFRGRWLIIRWIDTRPRMRQKRMEQGWQYFEGRDWCSRLGLDPDNYLNERGRVYTIDAELAWAPEEYIFQRDREAIDKHNVLVATAEDRLHAQQSSLVPRVEVIEGDDDSVLSELFDRKRFASARS